MTHRLLAPLLGALVLAAGPLAQPRPAAAQDADGAALDRARAHFRKGEKLYSLGRFREALAQYEAAFDDAPLPEFLFNIGQCHRNLKDYDAAIFSFKKYLRLRPDARNRVAVEKLIDDLEEERARAITRPPRVEPEPVEPPPPPPPPSPSRRSPIYARWWFWGGLALVAGAAATTVVLWPDAAGPPQSSLGNVDFPR